MYNVLYDAYERNTVTIYDIVYLQRPSLFEQFFRAQKINIFEENAWLP